MCACVSESEYTRTFTIYVCVCICINALNVSLHVDLQTTQKPLLKIQSAKRRKISRGYNRVQCCIVTENEKNRLLTFYFTAQCLLWFYAI